MLAFLHEQDHFGIIADHQREQGAIRAFGGGFTIAGGKVSAYIARAYLLPLPTLSTRRSGGDVMVSWPSADTADFALEQAGTLAPLATWAPNTASVTDDGTNKSVTLPATNPAQFFRLRRP